MSRWADDPEKAAGELIRRSLEAIAPSGRLLLVNQQDRALAHLLSAQGAEVAEWNRRCGAAAPAPWPPAGPFDTVLVRLPKAKDEQEMTVHAALGALHPGGRLVLYGGNDEGIRSAASRLGGLCGEVQTMAARGHGRVVAALRPAEIAALKPSLAAWRAVGTLTFAGTPHRWVSYPGLFAAGRLDEGTELLISALPCLEGGARVLDFGCGTGVIGAAVLAASPGIVLDMLDEDTVALEAARENVPAARLILGQALRDIGDCLYAAILSNPPLHRGIAETHDNLERLVAEAPAHLRPGGHLQIVVQRRVPLDSLLSAHLGNVAIVAENGRYRVWRATVTSPER